jgi:Na+/H+ antiporter NhaD/arsenite permease-like protein
VEPPRRARTSTVAARDATLAPRARAGNIAALDTPLAVFLAVYAGMVCGGLPGTRLDRTGIALLGAVLLVALRALPLERAWAAIDVGTLGLLLGLMLLSAQLRLSGFYAAITRALAARPTSPQRLLLELVLTAGALSAVLTNDVVCLAVAPVLVDVCRRRGLDPVPFLLGLAAASNTGSAATILGNPQNLLIGQTLHLSFSRYLIDGLPPALLGLLATWAILARAWAGRFERAAAPRSQAEHAFDRGQTGKGLAVLLLLVLGLFWCPLPNAVLALLAGGAVLLSRRQGTRDLLGLVDWPLLVLFMGLFVVNHALLAAGHAHRWLDSAAAAGLDVRAPAGLFAVTVIGSNVISNVPLVMLLLPAASHPQAGPILALASTLAGNLFLVGSIANLIVVEQARALGVEPERGSWARVHARTGVPIAFVTLALAAGWLWLRANVFAAW